MRDAHSNNMENDERLIIFIINCLHGMDNVAVAVNYRLILTYSFR